MVVLCQNKIKLKSSLSVRTGRESLRRWNRPPCNPQDLARPLPLSLIAAAMNLYLQLLLLTVSGWTNRHQQSVIEYLQAENRAYRCIASHTAEPEKPPETDSSKWRVLVPDAPPFSEWSVNQAYSPEEPGGGGQRGLRSYPCEFWEIAFLPIRTCGAQS